MAPEAFGPLTILHKTLILPRNGPGGSLLRWRFWGPLSNGHRPTALPLVIAEGEDGAPDVGGADAFAEGVDAVGGADLDVGRAP